jgi:hypothetical protein
MSNKNPSQKTRFKKNNNANPKGRPKGTRISGYLQMVLDESSGKLNGVDILNSELLARVLVREAAKGDMTAMKLVMDRMEGAVRQEITGANGSPLIPRNRIDFSGIDTESAMKMLLFLRESINSKAALEGARVIDVVADNKSPEQKDEL